MDQKKWCLRRGHRLDVYKRQLLGLINSFAEVLLITATCVVGIGVLDVYKRQILVSLSNQWHTKSGIRIKITISLLVTLYPCEVIECTDGQSLCQLTLKLWILCIRSN